MKNLRYAAVEIIAFPLRKLLLILLISVIFLESFATIQIGANLIIKKKQFENIFNDHQVIHLFDTTFALTKKEQKNILKKFEDLANKDFWYYSRFSTQITTVNTSNFHFQPTSSIELLLDSGDTSSIPQVIEANSTFFDEFPLDLSEGRFFRDEEFQKDCRVVILGADYKDHYNLGELINFGRSDNDYLSGKKDTLANIDYTVIGFLKPQKQIDLSISENSFSYQSLNQQMLLPQNELHDTIPENNLDQHQLMISNNQLDDIGMNNFNKLLADVNREISPIHLVLNDSSQQIANQLDMLNHQFFQLLIKLLIILTFSSVSFFICFNDIIKQRYKIFFVYLSIGSTKQDIVLINYLMTFVIITAGFCLSFFLKYFFTGVLIDSSENNLSLTTVTVSYILFTIWFSLLILPTISKIKTRNISAYLKEAFV